LLPHFSSCAILLLSLFYISKYTFLNWYPLHPNAFEMYGVFSTKIAVISLLVINLYYIVLYKFKFPFIEQFKSNTLPWPWEEDQTKWRSFLKDTVKTYLFNQFLVSPFIFILFLWAFPPLTDTESIPSFSTFLKHGLLMMTLEDFSFYWAHRLFHQPTMYRMFHKKHHIHFNTIYMTSVYSHWLEFALGNVTCMLLGMVLLNGHLHLVTLNAFIVFRLLETNEGHSGYDLPWSPFKIFPFSTDPSYHNYHHLKNMGNYGSFFKIWDTIFRTNKEYNIEIAKAENRKDVKVRQGLLF